MWEGQGWGLQEARGKGMTPRPVGSGASDCPALPQAPPYGHRVVRGFMSSCLCVPACAVGQGEKWPCRPLLGSVCPSRARLEESTQERAWNAVSVCCCDDRPGTHQTRVNAGMQASAWGTVSLEPCRQLWNLRVQWKHSG